MADVGGVIVAGFKGESEVSGQEGAAHLGDQLFAGVAGIAEGLASEVAVEALGVTRPVRGLMGERRVVAFGIAKALEGRHLDVIGADGVVRHVAAVTDVCAGGGKEGVGGLDPLHGIKGRFGQFVELCGQTLHLLDIEDGVAFQERDGAFFVCAGFGVGLGARDGIRVDDQLALLALADMRSHLGGLLVGHPDRRAVSAIHRGGPEHQDVDAVVGLAVMPQRACDAPGGVLSVPRLHPGPHALFEVGDDPVRDPAVDIFAFGVFVFHGDLLRLAVGSEHAEPEETGEKTRAHRQGNGQHGNEVNGAGRPLRERRPRQSGWSFRNRPPEGATNQDEHKERNQREAG